MISSYTHALLLELDLDEARYSCGHKVRSFAFKLEMQNPADCHSSYLHPQVASKFWAQYHYNNLVKWRPSCSSPYAVNMHKHTATPKLFESVSAGGQYHSCFITHWKERCFKLDVCPQTNKKKISKQESLIGRLGFFKNILPWAFWSKSLDCSAFLQATFSVQASDVAPGLSASLVGTLPDPQSLKVRTHHTASVHIWLHCVRNLYQKLMCEKSNTSLHNWNCKFLLS